MPLIKTMYTLPIFLLHITWPLIVMKSMLLAQVLPNKQQLLHKYQNVYESKNYINVLMFHNFSFTIEIVLTGPSVNYSESK